ncbi:hypothetical protein Tco_1577974 [Tanacetum coccineum]
MASSCCSSNVTPTPVLDEIIALSGETEIPKVMKIFFEQQIAEEEAFTKYIRDKIADVKASLTRVRTAIREMESKSDKDAWKDAIDCFKETKDRLELKLSRTDIKEMDKNKGKADKTEHGNGMSARIQFPVDYPPQETNKEILQAREDLMETIQAFLKEYDHIPPEEKCMALLFAEERFLKIKQAVEEEQNQPGVMQELLLKLMDDLQVLKGIQPKQEEPAVQSFTPYENFSMIDDVEVLMKDIYTFLRKFSRISFGVTPKVILIAWERFGEIKHALTDKQYQQEDIQELMSKLLEDVRNISEELSEYINCPSWNRPIFYNNDDDEYIIIYSKPKAITPDLPTVEPDNSLSMGDKHLETIPSVEILGPIPSEFEGISDDTCDVPVCEDPFTFDDLNDHYEILSDSNNDDTLSDDDDFEDIDRLITNIESLKDNLTPDCVLKSPSSFPIPVTDSDSFFEESDTSLSHLDNSLPETFSNHTEETRSGSTTTHANNSLPEYDSFLFEIEPDQGGLISVVISDNSNDPLLELSEFESFHFDPSFPRPSPELPDVEICLNFEPDTVVINNFDELNVDECFYPGGGEIVVSQNVEDDDSFTFVIRIFLPFLTYPTDSPLLLSTGSEDTIFDPGTDIKEMDKNKGKADKTEHGNGMSARIQVQRKGKSTWSKDNSWINLSSLAIRVTLNNEQSLAHHTSND